MVSSAVHGHGMLKAGNTFIGPNKERAGICQMLDSSLNATGTQNHECGKSPHFYKTIAQASFATFNNCSLIPRSAQRNQLIMIGIDFAWCHYAVRFIGTTGTQS
jgi:hypothetical protein